MSGKLTLCEFMPYRLVNLAKQVSDSCALIYMQRFDISIAEWRVLARLAEHDSLRAKDLGEITFMDKSRVSRAIKQLENRGYINRVANDQDNRASYVALTPQGRSIYEEIVPEALAWEADFLAALDVSEYRGFMKALDKLEAQVSVLNEQIES